MASAPLSCLMPIEPPEIPPATPGQPTEPPQEDPPGNPRPEVPPPMREPGEPPQPQELPGNAPEELPVRSPDGPRAPFPETDLKSRMSQDCKATPEWAMNNLGCNPLHE